MAANPRAAAVAALVRQEQDGFSNLVLDAELRRQKLEGRDKAFAGAIFYTVLEHQGTLDFILEQIWKLPASGTRPSASWCWALRGRMWQSFCAPITPRKRWAS